MAKAIELDHLAVAAHRVTDLWPRYAGDLGAGWVGMGPDVGFSFCQLRFGNGRRLEMLEPLDAGDDDFLHRFLDHTGPGPHHVTFKVPDLRAMLALLDNRGYHPVRVSFDDPEWFECFLHPKEAAGVVIQIAEVRRGAPETPIPAGVQLPRPRVGHAAELRWIGHAVASLDEGLRIFKDILHGSESGCGLDGDGNEWVELEWPDDARIRLLHRPHGLDGRPGRIHHVALTVDEPWAVPDAVEHATSGTWQVAPEHNFGLRLLLTPPPA